MDEGIELQELFKILLKHRVMILLLLIASVVTAAVVSKYFITPIYQAETSILVKTTGKMEMPFTSVTTLGKNEVGNYVEIFKSRSVVERVIENLGLDNEPSYEGINSLRNSITIQPVAGTDVIKIKVESPDPERARDIANGLVDIFVAESQMSNQAEARGAREFIEEQLLNMEAVLEKAEKDLVDYKTSQSITSPGEEGRALLQRLIDLDSARAGAQVSLSEAKTRLEKIYVELEGQADFVESTQTFSDNPFVKEYKAKLTGLEVELAGLLQNYTDKHPSIIRVKAEIEEVKKRLAQEEEKILASQTKTLNPVRTNLLQSAVTLRAEIAALEIKEEVLAEEIKRLEGELEKFPQKELELMRLMREKTVTEEIYLMLMTKREEMRISEAMKISDINLIDTAITPDSPIKPRKALNVAVTACLALFVGCGLAFVFEYLDTTIKTAEDVQAYLGLPVLGSIPIMSEESNQRSKRKGKHHGKSSGVPVEID